MPATGEELELTMKRLMVALLATTTLALAVPAFAHPEDHAVSTDEQWNNGGASYGDFNQEYQHIWDGIQHGLSDGSYTRSQAQQFYSAMQQIRARADYMNQNGQWNPQDTQARLAQLHNAMHQSHEAGHAIAGALTHVSDPHKLLTLQLCETLYGVNIWVPTLCRFLCC